MRVLALANCFAYCALNQVFYIPSIYAHKHSIRGNSQQA
uniref:Uncharacterized protein n=1 Tax=Curvibacter symbiont subsp. Hydra magnipapillata TaxID=667019 RepID=C9Y905_CURXX|nr:hypothetical protein Csp_A06060 [Curvibacter putative symbiont of Hydra magnipapillata]